MNVAHLNKFLHSGIPANYRIRVGDTVDVRLPQLPITADTEFVRLDLEASGVPHFETSVPDYGEGNMLPDHLQVTAVRPGSGILRITAVDALTQLPIPDVMPLNIKLTVQG